MTVGRCNQAETRLGCPFARLRRGRDSLFSARCPLNALFLMIKSRQEELRIDLKGPLFHPSSISFLPQTHLDAPPRGPASRQDAGTHEQNLPICIQVHFRPTVDFWALLRRRLSKKGGRGADEIHMTRIHMTRIQEMTGLVPDASLHCVSGASLADAPASLKCNGGK